MVTRVEEYACFSGQGLYIVTLYVCMYVYIHSRIAYPPHAYVSRLCATSLRLVPYEHYNAAVVTLHRLT
jgi:hypothetical protein